jgi:hypothetical protein
MTKKSEVPDPKSGSGGSTQKPDAVPDPVVDRDPYGYVKMTVEERTNEKSALKQLLTGFRHTMGELQSAAKRDRGKYGFVPEQTRECLIASRNAWRDASSRLYALEHYEREEEE